MIRLLAALLLWAVLAAEGSTAALAHASLIEAEPGDQTIVAAVPGEAVLVFSEPVKPFVTRLIRPDGRADILRDVQTRGAAIILQLPKDLGQGTHILSWRVISDDGHPIGGATLFSIGRETAPADEPQQDDPAVRAGLWLTRLAIALGMTLGIGGALFMAVIGQVPARTVRNVDTTLWLGLVAVPAFVAFQGLDTLGRPLADITAIEVWQAGITGTAFGRTALLAGAAFLVAFAARFLGRGLAPVAWLLAAGAVAASGHASTAPPTWLTRPSVFVHAATVIAWIGALLPLAGILRGPEGAPVLRRFSALIVPVLALVLASGTVLAVIQTGSVAALATTGYGRVLLAKLALVAMLLALASWNRFRLTRPVLADDPAAIRQLRRSIGVEIGLAVLVLAVIGLWRFTPPPRALAAMLVAVAGQERDLAKGAIALRATLLPPKTGPVRVEVSGILRNGQPFAAREVIVALSKPSFGIGPFERKAVAGPDGRWVASGLLLPMDGLWVLKVTVLVSDFEQVALSELFDVGAPLRP